MFKMQIRVWTARKGYYWVSVRPSWDHSWDDVYSPAPKFYEYETENEARRMLDMCYPNLIYGTEKRVVPSEEHDG